MSEDKILVTAHLSSDNSLWLEPALIYDKKFIALHKANSEGEYKIFRYNQAAIKALYACLNVNKKQISRLEQGFYADIYVDKWLYISLIH